MNLANELEEAKAQGKGVEEITKVAPFLPPRSRDPLLRSNIPNVSTRISTPNPHLSRTTPKPGMLSTRPFATNLHMGQIFLLTWISSC